MFQLVQIEADRRLRHVVLAAEGIKFDGFPGEKQVENQPFLPLFGGIEPILFHFVQRFQQPLLVLFPALDRHAGTRFSDDLQAVAGEDSLQGLDLPLDRSKAHLQHVSQLLIGYESGRKQQDLKQSPLPGMKHGPSLLSRSPPVFAFSPWSFFPAEAFSLCDAANSINWSSLVPPTMS